MINLSVMLIYCIEIFWQAKLNHVISLRAFSDDFFSILCFV